MWRLVLFCLCLAAPLRAQDVPALIAAARAQVGVTTVYDGAYVRLDFPGGDIDRSRGVCTDVVIRALRDAWGIDLQRAVNRDMKAEFAAFPALWGASGTDRSIDHRRVPNLEVLFARIGAEVPLSPGPRGFRPGDIVTSRLPGNLPHVMIVSDRTAPDGTPLVIHNIGAGAREEDRLFADPLVAHVRLDAAAVVRLRALDQD